jgi:hypothetical protein
MFCSDDIIDGGLLTKQERTEMVGAVDGGKGSMNPENYQRSKLIEGTKNKL